MALFRELSDRPSYILGKIIIGPPNGLFNIWFIGSDLWWKSGKVLKNAFQSPGLELK